MTLPELMISMVVIGLIVGVILASIAVTLKTQSGTEGRLNVARSEQSVATWLPADLSSAVSASDDPALSPCGTPSCPGVGALNGSNALLLTWPNGATDTKVGYIYRLEGGVGPLYELVRVECVSGSCKSVTVLHDLAGPDPATFVAGVTPVPDDVINVTIPLAVDAESENGATDATSGARRIIVTVNGGGTGDGDGGGVNRVSITAGGTDLGSLAAEKVTGPSFLKAQSRCGGPITIIVDDSGSIANAGAGASVETAVRGFVKALAGTPTKVQIIRFSSESALIADASAVAGYHDMTNTTAVNNLVGDDDGTPAGLIRTNLAQSGGTNWEDAIYRTFYSSSQLGVRLDADGDPTTFLPNLVVFFTDGEPTLNTTLGSSYRFTSSAPPGPPTRTKPKWPTANGQAFDQEGYDRAEYWINDFRNSEQFRIVGVGVGDIATNRVVAFNDTIVQGYSRGLVYSNANVYRRNSSGGATGGAFATNTTTEKVLGNFVVGGDLLTAGTPYVKATLNTSTNPPTWNNTDAADLFITDQWNALASALTQIALGECGGTLTMQTKMTNGTPAQADVSYETQGEIVTTSRVTRASSFDFEFPTGVGFETTVVPQDLASAGFTAQSWACELRGLPLSPTKWSLVSPGNPSAGIKVNVAPNDAISCTLTVA